MTKVAQDETMIFGQRLAELRKARGFTLRIPLKLDTQSTANWTVGA